MILKGKSAEVIYCKKAVCTAPVSAKPERAVSAEPRRAVSAKPVRAVPAKPGRAVSAEPGRTVPAKPGRAVLAESGRTVPAESGEMEVAALQENAGISFRSVENARIVYSEAKAAQTHTVRAGQPGRCTEVRVSLVKKDCDRASEDLTIDRLFCR